MNETNDLLSMLHNKMPELSKGQKRIANFLIEHYDKAVYLTASKLGEIAGVSESTVVRFAKEDKHILKAILEGDEDRIHSTLNDIDTDEFDKAIEYILKAKRIYIVGGRSASALSNFLSFYLNLMLDNVINASSSTTTETFEQIFRIEEGDVLIGISFPRYSNKTVKAMEYAYNQGAKTIAITDGKFSPMVKSATVGLIARSYMVSFVDSLVAPLSLINAILVSISMNRKDKIVDSLDKLERMWGEYQVYSSTNLKKYL